MQAALLQLLREKSAHEDDLNRFHVQPDPTTYEEYVQREIALQHKIDTVKQYQQQCNTQLEATPTDVLLTAYVSLHKEEAWIRRSLIEKVASRVRQAISKSQRAPLRELYVIDHLLHTWNTFVHANDIHGLIDGELLHASIQQVQHLIDNQQSRRLAFMQASHGVDSEVWRHMFDLHDTRGL